MPNDKSNSTMTTESNVSLTVLLNEIKNIRNDFKEDNQKIQTLMENKFSILIADSKETKAKVEKLEVKSNLMEKEMVRRNLIIYGLEEDSGESLDDLKNKLLYIFNEKMELNIAVQEIDQFHRMGSRDRGKKRAVLVKMVSGWRKSEILRSSGKLKGTKLYVEMDLTKEEQEERNKMLELMKQHRRQGDYAVVRGSKLYVSRNPVNKEETAKQTVESAREKQFMEWSSGEDVQASCSKTGGTKRQISPGIGLGPDALAKKRPILTRQLKRSNSLVLGQTPLEKYLRDHAQRRASEKEDQVERDTKTNENKAEETMIATNERDVQNSLDNEKSTEDGARSDNENQQK